MREDLYGMHGIGSASFQWGVAVQRCHRLFVALGGGGRSGMAAPVEVEDVEEDDPRRLLPVVALLRPGIAMEKVCPSFKL